MTQRVTFAEHMERVLYDPISGYYAKHVPGGDYQTSPTISPWFGRLISGWVTEAFKELGEPGGFTVLEVGGGDGSLARSVLDPLDDKLASKITWTFIERFGAISDLQRVTVEGLPAVFSWAEDLPHPKTKGVIIANEVIDNFPFHLMTIQDGEIAELFVSETEDGLGLDLGQPSASVAEKASAALTHLQEGDTFEVRDTVDAWTQGCYESLEEGYALVIDYGDLRPDLWTRRPSGSAVAYADERLRSVLAGGTDITAHVDFTQLAECFERAGFTDVATTTQAQFLGGLGYAEAAAGIKAKRAGGSDIASLLSEGSKLSLLVREGGLGDFLVLQAAKGARAFWT
jgi:SAM-dependent MidA family methyltransferase